MGRLSKPTTDTWWPCLRRAFPSWRVDPGAPVFRSRSWWMVKTIRNGSESGPVTDRHSDRVLDNRSSPMPPRPVSSNARFSCHHRKVLTCVREVGPPQVLSTPRIFSTSTCVEFGRSVGLLSLWLTVDESLQQRDSGTSAGVLLHRLDCSNQAM